MARDRPLKLFVSYSHNDIRAWEACKPFLTPLERDGKVRVWIDHQIEAGDDWGQEIDAALAEADVALLFVSQDFLASPYIIEVEAPALLRRWHAKELTLIPVLLSHATTDITPIHYTDGHGRQRKKRITELQCIGTPEDPLSSRAPEDRRKAWGELARRLENLASRAVRGGRSGQHATSVTHRATLAAASPGPSRFDLHVHLTRSGDLLRTIYTIPAGEVFDPIDRPWSEVRDDVEALLARLRDRDPQATAEALDRAHLDWGATLFDLAFGPDQQWEPVLRALFATPPEGARRNPSFAPVRLRIVTDDPLLAALPWGLLAWNQRLLRRDAWQIVVSQREPPTTLQRTQGPCDILVIAPAGPREDDGALVRALQDVVDQLWPSREAVHYLRTARTRIELERAVQGRSPHVLLFFGAAGNRPDQLGLQLGGPRGDEILTLAELAQILAAAGSPPRVVYLDAAGLQPLRADGSVLPGPGLELARIAPLVIWRGPAPRTPRSFDLVPAWLKAWLGQGIDPVDALYALASTAPELDAELRSLHIHADYRDWQTLVLQTADARSKPLLALDREHQKALAAKHVRDLADSPSRRVLAMVAYAGPGNRLEALGEQLRHYLELASADVAAIRSHHPPLPVDRERLDLGLPAALREHLQAQHGEADRDLLWRSGPRVVEPGQRRLLWLDWGVCGSGEGCQAPMSGRDIEAWLQFCSEHLGKHCPDESRIVAFLAIETPESKHKKLHALLQDKRKAPWGRSPRFRLADMPPLGRVTEQDLVDFLDDPRNSTCDPGILGQVAECLVRATGGAFARTLALIEEAEQGSWYALLRRLRCAEGSAGEADDETF